jgi:hypothetical protein
MSATHGDLDAYTQLNAAAALVREYAGSQTSKALAELLDHLERSYLQDLRTVKPELLARVQTALLQVESLRKLIEGDPHTNGRY